MARTRRLLFVGLLSVSLFHIISADAFGQHSGNCTCVACAGGQSFGTQSPFGSSVSGSMSLGGSSSFSSSPIGQTVFLDFDSGDDGDVDYTQAIRDGVQAQLETIYQDFGVTFVQSAPTSGDSFSTLTFNEGGIGGLAEGIDFRNLNQSDNAILNVSGFSTDSAVITGLSANVAAHELGHLLGLRHRDAFGPIGSGVAPGTGGSFNPVFTGPAGGVEIQDHVLLTGAAPFSQPASFEPLFFSERSAIKLSAITQVNVVDEVFGDNNSIATAQALELGQLVVPNTILEGQNAGLGDFDVDAIVVTGSIGVGTDEDFYSFEGEAGDLFNFEVISTANSNIFDSVDSQITILDADGNPLNYFGSPAFNDDEIETFDSVIIDLVLEESGTFFVQIESFGTGFPFNSTGDYELFFTRFNGAFAAVPEPGSLALLSVCFVACGLRRRSR